MSKAKKPKKESSAKPSVQPEESSHEPLRRGDLNEVEIELYTEQILKMHTRRMTVRQIAEELELPKTTVNNLLRKVVSKYRKTNQGFINQVVHEALDALNEVEYESWIAWEKSKLDGGKTKTEGVQRSDQAIDKQIDKLLSAGSSKAEKNLAGLVKVITERYEQYGDPRMLAVIVRSVLAKAKLLESLNLKQAQNDAIAKLAELMGVKSDDAG